MATLQSRKHVKFSLLPVCFIHFQANRAEILFNLSFISFSAGIFPAICIVGASYAGCNRVLVVCLFILTMGFKGNFYPGLKVNSLDLSPNYAGSLMALTNGLGASAGIGEFALCTVHVCIEILCILCIPYTPDSLQK